MLTQLCRYYAIMLLCWDMDPTARPSFKDIALVLDTWMGICNDEIVLKSGYLLDGSGAKLTAPLIETDSTDA